MQMYLVGKEQCRVSYVELHFDISEREKGRTCFEPTLFGSYVKSFILPLVVSVYTCMYELGFIT